MVGTFEGETASVVPRIASHYTTESAEDKSRHTIYNPHLWGNQVNHPQIWCRYIVQSGFVRGRKPFAKGYMPSRSAARNSALVLVRAIRARNASMACPSGMPLELVVEKALVDSEGNDVMTFKFRPAKEGSI